MPYSYSKTRKWRDPSAITRIRRDVFVQIHCFMSNISILAVGKWGFIKETRFYPHTSTQKLNVLVRILKKEQNEYLFHYVGCSSRFIGKKRSGKEERKCITTSEGDKWNFDLGDGIFQAFFTKNTRKLEGRNGENESNPSAAAQLIK